jgi:hypothetical protein
MGPEQYANRIASSLEEQYGKAKALAAEGPGTAGESFNWEYTETLSLENSIGGLLSISRDRDYYLGGAHGMRERQFFNIYPTEGKKIGLRDLIQPERMAEFRGLAEKALGSRKKIPRGTGLRAGGFFEDTVEIPENFCPSPEGLILHWDPYEIAPYSMGPVEICIPWTELDPLLSDRGRFLVKR